MPYILKSKREILDARIDDLSKDLEVAGDLNYTVTRLCHLLIKRKGLNYANINELIGALSCVEHELYNRIAVPYETSKIEQNGDIGVLDV